MANELRDPFKTKYDFLSFMANNNDYSLRTIQLINENDKGRIWLDKFASLSAQRDDYSQLDPKILISWIEIGAFYQILRELCGEENLRFPIVGFNQQFIYLLFCRNPQKPFDEYQKAILYVYTGNCALNAMEPTKHPYLCQINAQAITLSPHFKELQEEWQRSCPYVPLPDLNEAFRKLNEDSQRKYYALKPKFEDVSDLENKVRDRLYDLIDEETDKNPEKTIDAGLKDGLCKYMNTAIWRGIEKKRKRDAKFYIEGTQESILAAQQEKRTGIEIEGSYFDTIPSPDLGRSDYEYEQEQEEQENKKRTIEEHFDKVGLTSSERKVYWLKEGQSLSHKEVAQYLGISIRAVAKHYSEANRKLRETST